MAQQMMCRIYTSLLIALAALFLAAPPAQSLEIKGKDSGSYDFPASDELPGFKYQVAWKVWTLMGSVITDAQIKWQLPDGAWLPLPEPPGGNANISTVPQAAWERISLYDVKLQVVGHLKNRSDLRYSIIIDLGVPWKPGQDKWSFNVPGSPEWDKLVTHFNGGVGQYRQYLSASEAKNLFKEGFVAYQTWLIDPKLSLVAYFDKLLEGRADWRADVMSRTVTDQIGNIERYAGLPTAKLQERLDRAVAAIKENPKRIPDDLQRLFDKLNTGIPDKYIRPARREIYSRERDKSADKGQAELKLLLPGGRSDGYTAWRNAKQAELKKRKPPVDFAGDAFVGEWAHRERSNWVIRADGSVRFKSKDGVTLSGTWLPDGKVSELRLILLKHQGKIFRQVAKISHFDAFELLSYEMPASVNTSIWEIFNASSLYGRGNAIFHRVPLAIPTWRLSGKWTQLPSKSFKEFPCNDNCTWNFSSNGKVIFQGPSINYQGKWIVSCHDVCYGNNQQYILILDGARTGTIKQHSPNEARFKISYSEPNRQPDYFKIRRIGSREK